MLQQKYVQRFKEDYLGFFKSDECQAAKVCNVYDKSFSLNPSKDDILHVSVLVWCDTAKLYNDSRKVIWNFLSMLHFILILVFQLRIIAAFLKSSGKQLNYLLQNIA